MSTARMAGRTDLGKRGRLRFGRVTIALFAGAVGTGSVEVDVVRDVDVAVLSREVAGVEFEFGGSEPDRVAAPPAQQISPAS